MNLEFDLARRRLLRAFLLAVATEAPQAAFAAASRVMFLVDQSLGVFVRDKSDWLRQGLKDAGLVGGGAPR
jgi:hypothetical protein